MPSPDVRFAPEIRLISALLLTPMSRHHLALAAQIGTEEIVAPFPGTDLDALREAKAQGSARKLVGFEMVGRGIARHGYPIVIDGIEVGEVTSGSPGVTVGKNIGLGYVRNAVGVDKDYLQSGHYELEVAGERHPCELQLQALYDPAMKRMKC